MQKVIPESSSTILARRSKVQRIPVRGAPPLPTGAWNVGESKAQTPQQQEAGLTGEQSLSSQEKAVSLYLKEETHLAVMFVFMLALIAILLIFVAWVVISLTQYDVPDNTFQMY